jgi:hypothetical protein
MLASLRGLKTGGEETTTCKVTSKAGLEGTEAADLEVTLEKTEAAVERQKLRTEELNIDNIGPLEDRYGDRHLIVRRRRWAKKLTQSNNGFQKNLAAA